MRTTAMQIEFADLVRRDYMHTDEFAIVYAMLGVALVMQMAAVVWTIKMTPYEMQRPGLMANHSSVCSPV